MLIAGHLFCGRGFLLGEFKKISLKFNPLKGERGSFVSQLSFNSFKRVNLFIRVHSSKTDGFSDTEIFHKYQIYYILIKLTRQEENICLNTSYIINFLLKRTHSIVIGLTNKSIIYSSKTCHKERGVGNILS